MLVDFFAGFPTLLLATQLYVPASSDVMAGMVNVPPLRTVFSGRTPADLTHVRLGAGSPPVVTQTKVIASPGFTTIGSSTRSLIEGDAAKHKRKRKVEWGNTCAMAQSDRARSSQARSAKASAAALLGGAHVLREGCSLSSCSTWLHVSPARAPACPSLSNSG